MSGKEKRVPKRRFKEFENAGDWEKRKLGDVIDGLYNGQTPSRFRDDFWNGNINWLSSGELNRSVVTTTSEKITVAGQNDANLRIVPKNTFVMAITGLEAAGTRGNCGILGIDTTLNQSCMAIFPNKKLLNIQFLFQWYKMIGEDYGIRFTQGTKQRSYNAEIIKNLDICLPKVEEQLKIGELLSELDNLITLHQHKLEKMKVLKKAYLTEMFPAEGESKPKLRFAGFTDDWEQRKLGEIVEFLDGQRKPLESGTRESGEYPYYGASGIIDYVKDYLFDEELILLSEDGANIVDRNYRVCFLASGKYWVNNHAHVLKSKDNYCNGFICEALERLDYNQYNTGTAQPKLNQEVCRNINIMVPNLEEQERISSYLVNLDNLITLHQRKLEKLQNIKKAYLNEMFI